jgi:flagellar protein FlaJ
MSFFKYLSKRMVGLDEKLVMARIKDTPEYYVKKTINSAFYLSLALTMIIFMFLQKPFVIIFFPVLMGISFFYLMGYVDMRILKMSREIDQEIVFAGRFLLIEIESGVPVYNAFINISKNYQYVGPFFYEVVENIKLGTSMEEALNEAVSKTPSANMRKIFWQILNSMKTGADISDSLNAVIDQIVRRQQIAVKEYGRKLNPLAMFYMMAAVIIPSLGTTIAVVLATFLGFSLPLPFLLTFALVMAFVQFMFLSVVKSSRPPMDL